MSNKYSRTIQNKLYEKILSAFNDKITSGRYDNIDVHDVGIISECIYFVLDYHNSGHMDSYIASYQKATGKK